MNVIFGMLIGSNVLALVVSDLCTLRSNTYLQYISPAWNAPKWMCQCNNDAADVLQ